MVAVPRPPVYFIIGGKFHCYRHGKKKKKKKKKKKNKYKK
jgi:hypothetical protein